MTADPADGMELDAAGLRDRALVAFLISTGCRISEALALDRADWNRTSVIVRGKGDVERSVVITDRASSETRDTGGGWASAGSIRRPVRRR